MKSLRSIGYRDAWRVKKNHNLPYSWQVAARHAYPFGVRHHGHNGDA